MSRFVPKVPPLPPLGAGFVRDPTTGLYDVDGIWPQLLSGPLLATDLVTVVRDTGTVEAPNLLLYSAAMSALLAGGTTPAPTPTPTPSGSTIPADGTLSGLPSTIVAGQPLSAASYIPTTGSAPNLVLWNVAAGAEEGSRFSPFVMPGGTLSLLIPQRAGAYTVRGFAASAGGTATYESGQISVTAAPGALPAMPTQAADTGATATSVIMNWTSTATSYHVLARAGVGASYGSLSDQAQWPTNSFSFQNLEGNSSPRAVIIPQNANGYGTPTGQFISFVQGSVAATAASALAGVPSSVPVGTTIGGYYNYEPHPISTTLTPAGSLAWAVRYNNGDEVGTRAPLSGSLLPEFRLDTTTSSGSTLRIYSAKTGGTLLQESAPITVTAS